jgi:tetratricopeptide (TPR) repeat protein
MAAMKEMADDPDYQKHPLAAGAIRTLADNQWNNKEKDLALKYWKQVCAQFWQTNQQETNIARSNVTGVYVRERNYVELEAWLVSAENRENVDHRLWVANQTYDAAWNGFAGDWWGKYTPFNQKEKAEDMQAFYEWFVRQRDWYEKKGQPWEFHYRRVQFLTNRWGAADRLRQALDETVAFVNGIKDKGDANGKFAWIVDRLREGRQFERARYCIAKISDVPLAAFKEYEVLGHGEGRWGDAAAKLLEIMNMDNDNWRHQAHRTLGWVYKDATHEYEKAIKVFEDINEPPGTLWEIQECYHRMGKLPETLRTLTEIENMFPDNAARAAWHKAYYQKEAGNRTEAIAQARRVLKMYKEAPEASNAHQLLEELKVEDTGGGVTNQE